MSNETQSLKSLSEDLNPGDLAEMLQLLLHRAEWIHRRVESVNLEDRGITRRKISVDLTVPAVFVKFGYVPIAALKKQQLKKFDALSSSGESLSVLTAKENAEIARLILAKVRDFTNKDISDSLLKKIVSAADLKDELAIKLLAELFEAFSPASDTTLEFMYFAHELLTGFLLFVKLPNGIKPGDRTVLKFAYDDTLDATPKFKSSLQRVVVSLDWAKSFHFEVNASTGLLVSGMSIMSKDIEIRSKWNTVALSPNGTSNSIIDHVTTQNKSGWDGPYAVAYTLKPERSGVPTAALVASLFTLFPFAVLSFREKYPSLIELVTDKSATSGLLALIPALFLTWLARGSEHFLYSRMVYWARFSMLLDAALLFCLSAISIGFFGGIELTKFYIFVFCGLSVSSILLGVWRSIVCAKTE